MEADTYQEIQALSRLTVGQLREKYLDVFGEETRSRHKEFLRKRIAWRLQGEVVPASGKDPEGGTANRQVHRRVGDRPFGGILARAAIRIFPARSRRIPRPESEQSSRRNALRPGERTARGRRGAALRDRGDGAARLNATRSRPCAKN